MLQKGKNSYLKNIIINKTHLFKRKINFTHKIITKQHIKLDINNNSTKP